MTDKSLNSADLEQCQKAILDFLPPPVTDRQRETLEQYQSGSLEAVGSDTARSGDYERCLGSLLDASKDDANSVESLKMAAEGAIKYAGVADGSELYAVLSEILPNEFADAGAAD